MESDQFFRAGKKNRTKAVESGLRKTYKSLKEAFASEDAEGWRAAAELEFTTLTAMGVFAHGYTAKELKRLGYKDPINLSVQLDNKYVDGEFDRHKVRMTVAGHKYNLTKGVDRPTDQMLTATANSASTPRRRTMTWRS